MLRCCSWRRPGGWRRSPQAWRARPRPGRPGGSRL